MAPPRQKIKARDLTIMGKIGARFDAANAEQAAAQDQLDGTVLVMVGRSYNVSAIARELGVTRNVVYRSLDRSRG